jgi:hypothetical protein
LRVFSSESIGLRRGSFSLSGGLGNDGTCVLCESLSAGKGDGDDEPFLRLRRRAERSDSGLGFFGASKIGVGLASSVYDLTKGRGYLVTLRNRVECLNF